jgi:hypothetical protein
MRQCVQVLLSKSDVCSLSPEKNGSGNGEVEKIYICPVFMLAPVHCAVLLQGVQT